MSRFIFTSESVSMGHPDKVSDQVSDGVLDALLAQDPMARVACETLCTTDFVCLAGEITSTAKVDYEKVARDVDPRHRLHQRRHRLQRRHLPSAGQAALAEPGHRHGRRSRRSRRPGVDVRLRLQPDAGTDAAADRPVAPHPQPADRSCASKAKSTGCGPTARARSRSSTKTARPVGISAIVVSTQHREQGRPADRSKTTSSTQVIRDDRAERAAVERTRSTTSTRRDGSSSAGRTATAA